MFTFLRKHKLDRWVRGYVEEKSLTYPSAADEHHHWLKLFCEVVSCDMTEISLEEIERFSRHIDETESTRYARLCAIRSVSCFLRFYRARGHKYLPVIPMHLYSRHARICR